MNYLIVIDMQTEFYNTESLLLNAAIEREIKIAKKKRHKIVFVEYNGSGKTNKNLHEALGSYKRFSKITKYSNDGSAAITKKLKLKSDQYHYIKLCGVYTDFCVRSTFEGLHEKLPKAKFEIIADACSGYNDNPMYIFRGFTRTKIVSKPFRSVSKAA